MTVEAIEPHGFCSGVKSALQKALCALDDFGGSVYCLHGIVHNERVVDALAARGMRFVETLAAVPDGATVLFSAHGVAPAVREAARRRRMRIVDATCPFVERLHREVREHAAQGRPVVVIGRREHAEVAGVVGEFSSNVAPAGAHVPRDCALWVVSTGAEVERLPLPRGIEIGVVCQTTLAQSTVDEVLAAFHARDLRTVPSSAPQACTATRDRQAAVRDFVRSGGDGVLVLGSATSSNTKRLAEIAAAEGARAWRVATTDELAKLDFGGIRKLGVTSGASTPEDFFVQIWRMLSARSGADGSPASWIDS